MVDILVAIQDDLRTSIPLLVKLTSDGRRSGTFKNQPQETSIPRRQATSQLDEKLC